MKKINKLSKLIKIVFLSIILICINACQPNDSPTDNGLSMQASDLNANFTISQIGTTNRYILDAVKTNVLGSKWNLGDGNPTFVGQITQNIFLPDAGTYTIVHTAIGKGGIETTSSQTIIVATSDVNSGNLVQGGKFQNAQDHSKWTVLNIAGTNSVWSFLTGSAKIAGASTSQYSQQGIFQAIQIVANKQYRVDMLISGGGANQMWFEVYVGTAVPNQGSDYGSGGKRIALNTWDGCGVVNFNAPLSTISCGGTGNLISFPTSGTVYLVMRSGGLPPYTHGPNGVSITNVSFRGI